MTDDQGNLQLLTRIGDTVHTDLGDVTMGGDFVLRHGTGRDGLSSSGNRRDQLAIFNNGFNPSYAYLLTVGTPTPPAPTLGAAFNRGGLTLSWPSGFKLQRADTLSPINWGDINVTSPYGVPTTNQQGFFRLSSQ